MWRAGSPEGYQPPIVANHEGFSADDSSAAWLKPQQSSFAALQNLPSNRPHRGKSTGALQPCLQQAYSQDSEHSTRPGTPPSTSAVHQANRYSARGYQPLLDPLLPVSDLQPLTSPTQPSAQRDVHRTSSFLAADRASSDTSIHLQHIQHDRSTGFSEQSLPGLNVPLEPHEHQLLNNLLHRSHSTRSQDRSSDRSHSSASTHHDGQLPLSRLHSLPRSFSDRRLSSNSVLRCDKGMLHEPSELSRYTYSPVTN